MAWNQTEADDDFHGAAVPPIEITKARCRMNAVPMTIPELNEAVRAIVPPYIATFVRQEFKTYMNGDKAVEVSIAALDDLRCKIVYAPTEEEALRKFRLETLPCLELADVAPAVEA